MTNKKLNLLEDFPQVTTQQWLDVITKDLKGADFNKKLVWHTNEGFDVQPFYRSEDIEQFKTTEVNPAVYPYVRSTKPTNEWLIRQNIEVEDAKLANNKALDLLNKGVTSLGFRLNKKDLSMQFVADLLQNIVPTAVELNFTICVSKAAELVSILIDYFKTHNYFSSPELLVGSINLDPINRMLLKGKKLTKEFVAEKLKSTVLAAAELPCYRVVGVNAGTLSNAGAFVAQELGYALSWGNEYLSTMIDSGVDKTLAAKKIKFNFGVGSNYFMEIAKFRAARLLWSQIVNAYQPDVECKSASKMRIHAETTKYNMTIFDANVNMLRSQTEAMSAAIAGVDSLTVLPYDSPYKTPDDFSERIARNQQLLLKEESHFDKVVDPSAGSYYIETLTQELAKQAWAKFLAVEKEGGFFAAIQNGSVQKEIIATASSRLKSVSNRREILLGTNQFPNFTEKALQKVEKEVKVSDSCGCDALGTAMLLPVRGSEEFEALRFETEKAGKRPKAFMLTIGNLAMRLARAQFSSNFFACAGYEIIDNLGFKTVEDGVKAALAADADVVILCSSDDEYAEYAPQANELLKNKVLLVVAGAPACADDLKAQGITSFINVKSNVLETLKEFNTKLLA